MKIPHIVPPQYAGISFSLLYELSPAASPDNLSIYSVASCMILMKRWNWLAGWLRS